MMIFKANKNLLGEEFNIFQEVLQFALEMLPLHGSINWCSLLGLYSRHSNKPVGR